MNDSATATAVAEDTKVEKKTATKETGDFLVDLHTRISTYGKQKVINRVDALLESDGETNFELGGLLLQINNQNWYEGYENLDEFVQARFGFQARKARYLMNIFKELVEKNIPWEAVKDVGWTKLRELAARGVLTAENAAEMAEKAKGMSAVQLIAFLKAAPEGDGSPSASTKDDIQTVKFKLKNDQIETVNSALAKAKSEANTEFDNVAFELICQGYLSGGSAAPPKLKELMLAAGAEEVLQLFDQVFPGWTLSVDPPEEVAA